jgi:hypothetical protein
VKEAATDERERTIVALETARAVAESFSASLPASIDPAIFTLRSKLPFKALSIRELLIHRVAALANAAILLFERHNYLGGVVVTRSVLKTVAVAFALERALNTFLRVKDVEALDAYLMKLLLPSRAPDAKHQAMDITGLVNNVDKKNPGFRDTYNAFSECAHPNWLGTLGAFGSVDQETRVLNLGMTEASTLWGAGVHALGGLLMEFERIYGALPVLLAEINLHFENADSA